MNNGPYIQYRTAVNAPLPTFAASPNNLQLNHQFSGPFGNVPAYMLGPPLLGESSQFNNSNGPIMHAGYSSYEEAAPFDAAPSFDCRNDPDGVFANRPIAGFDEFLLNTLKQAHPSPHCVSDSGTKSLVSRPCSGPSVRSKPRLVDDSIPPVDTQKPRLRRPLTAYNFFYRVERKRLLQEKSNETSDAVTDSILLNEFCGRILSDRSTFIEQVLQDQRSRDPSVKRKHRKVHGKISFQTLAQRIGANWQASPNSVKEVFRDVSDRDSRRCKQLATINESSEVGSGDCLSQV
jgi:hypothetical protein